MRELRRIAPNCAELRGVVHHHVHRLGLVARRDVGRVLAPVAHATRKARAVHLVAVERRRRRRRVDALVGMVRRAAGRRELEIVAVRALVEDLEDDAVAPLPVAEGVLRVGVGHALGVDRDDFCRQAVVLAVHGVQRRAHRRRCVQRARHRVRRDARRAGCRQDVARRRRGGEAESVGGGGDHSFATARCELRQLTEPSAFAAASNRRASRAHLCEV